MNSDIEKINELIKQENSILQAGLKVEREIEILYNSNKISFVEYKSRVSEIGFYVAQKMSEIA